MLQGVQFAIHVSYLYELRAESAGVDIAFPDPPLISLSLLYPNV